MIDLIIYKNYPYITNIILSDLAINDRDIPNQI